MKVLRQFKINLPPLPTQKKIAAILSAYDDLIENNRKRIQLLEEAAQNIYREWFVHFRYPGHEQVPFDPETGLPEGWERRIIGELIKYNIGGGWGKETIEPNYETPAYVVRGTDIPKLKQGDPDSVPYRFHQKSNLKSRKLQPNDIIFEVSGGSAKYPVGRSIFINETLLDYFEGEEVMCASFCKLIRPNEDVIFPLFFSLSLENLYQSGKLKQYESRSASNIVNFKFKYFLEGEELLMPPRALLTDFLEIVTPINNLSGLLGKELKLLQEARDILLPRLMNQTIEV